MTRKVQVRMYRQGLGDCFLLSFTKGKSGVHHMLIDCGVILGSDTDLIKAAARDIAAFTKKRLDTVVATHEHWDHISGFTAGQAQESFDEIKFGEVWFAWTEDDKDPQARRLRRGREESQKAVWAAVAQGAALGLDTPSLEMAEQLVQFFGPAAAGKNTTASAREYLLGRGKQDGARFLAPGQHFQLPGVEGLRIYVLGPPRDETRLKKDLPTKKAPETYEDDDRHSPSLAASFLATVESRAAAAAGGAELAHPFDAVHRIPYDDARRHAFFGARYGFDEQDANHWRTIDTDWLRVAGELALNLDSDTNNTSLVLAFELEPDGRVLLFAADAQVGNWQSWQDVTFDVRTPERRKVTATDLLARTVLYKVGHHASHNATLRALGLELMTHPDLIALIPVDEDMARKKGKGWNMPFPPLLNRLMERTRGRVIRIDHGVPGTEHLGQLGREERDDFRGRVRGDQSLFIELDF